QQEVYHIRGNASHAANESQLDYVKSFLEDCTFPLSSEDLVNPEAIQLITNAQTASFSLTNLPEQAEVSVINSLGQTCGIQRHEKNSFSINEPAGIYYIQVRFNNQELKILPYYNKE
ncbi:MAG: T9SS type A sorting domain-containing protein, partial [Bacteroidota bacterium]|nr:T9SS type A sorting domain-containing protein [Bacteroidota bacterium]